LKPRGFFVDEHSLLVNSELDIYKDYSNEIINKTDFLNDSKPNFVFELFCRNLNMLNKFDICVSVSKLSKQTETELFQISVDSYYNSKSSESILILLHFDASSVSINIKILEKCASLIVSLQKSKWLAKRVIILFLIDNKKHKHNNKNIGKFKYSKILNEWLNPKILYENNRMGKQNNTEFLNNKDIINSFKNNALLRQSYIFDFSSFYYYEKNNTILNKDKNLNSINNNQSFAFEKIVVLNSGVNGNMPNMDIISFLIALFPNIFLLESSVHEYSINICYDLLKNFKNINMNIFKINSNKGIIANSRKNKKYLINDQSIIIVFLINNLNKFLNFFNNEYKLRFCSMISHFYFLITGPTGIHWQFLIKNVDSVTFLIQNKNYNKNYNDKNNNYINFINNSNDYKNKRNNKNFKNEDDLFKIILKIVYISSNLYGFQNFYIAFIHILCILLLKIYIHIIEKKNLFPNKLKLFNNNYSFT
jgi:putative heme iron utilization protein